MPFVNPPSAPLFQRGERGISADALLNREMLRNMEAFFKRLKSYKGESSGEDCAKHVAELFKGVPPSIYFTFPLHLEFILQWFYNGFKMELLRRFRMPVNLSIKNVPDDVAEEVRKRAVKHHRSLQGELISILEETVAQERRMTPFAHFKP
jgi:Antitoxin FitA-like, ribbon-helix-helix